MHTAPLCGHWLQRSIGDLFKSSPVLTQLFADVNALVTTVTKSGPVQQTLNELQTNSGAEPLRMSRMVSTRWNAAYVVMRRVAVLAQHIPVACAMHNKKQNVDFDMLPHVVSMLAPVFSVRKHCKPTGHIQDCYLAIKNVVSALNKNETPLRNEAQLLARLINERFSFFYKVVPFSTHLPGCVCTRTELFALLERG